MSTSQPIGTTAGRPSRGQRLSPGTRERHLLEPYPRLFWRVFAINAAVLALACALAVVVFSPGTFSSPVALKELGIFVGALAVMVAANLLLTRRITAPLEDLVALMRRVDPLHPGVRVGVRGGPSEAAELARAFNEMLDRLERERDESTRRALNAQESERLRVAQELHDEIGQNLTAAVLQLARIRKRAPAELRGELTEAAETVRENLDDLRRIAQRLRPQALDELLADASRPHVLDGAEAGQQLLDSLDQVFGLMSRRAGRSARLVPSLGDGHPAPSKAPWACASLSSCAPSPCTCVLRRGDRDRSCAPPA